MKSLREGKDGEIMPVQMNWITGQKVPMTGRHFLSYRGENSSAADGTYWIARIPHPILMLRDQADGIILPFEPHMLLSAAHAEGSLVPSISYVVVPDQHPVGAAGHVFTDNTQPLIDAISAWLAEQHL